MPSGDLTVVTISCLLVLATVLPRNTGVLNCSQCTVLEKELAVNSERLRLLNQEIVMAERRVKGLTTMVHNLEEKKASIEAEQKRLADELTQGRGNADAIREQIRKLDVQLQSVIDGLADKES